MGSKPSAVWHEDDLLNAVVAGDASQVQFFVTEAGINPNIRRKDGAVPILEVCI